MVWRSWKREYSNRLLDVSLVLNVDQALRFYVLFVGELHDT